MPATLNDATAANQAIRNPIGSLADLGILVPFVEARYGHLY